MARRSDRTRQRTRGALPSKGEIVEFLRNQGERAGKREIARAFHVKGEARAALKDLLREMSEEGLIGKTSGRRLSAAGELPPVAVLDIIEQDPDGELLCRPAKWEHKSPPPPILLAPREGAGERGLDPAVGVGDRILARIGPREDGGPHIARLIRVIGEGAPTVLGVYRAGRGARGEGFIEPTDRRQRTTYVVAQSDRADAQDGDLVIAEPRGPARERRARVRERLGSLREPRNISLIAIHTHGLPVDFPAPALAEAERVRPVSPNGRADLTGLPLVTIDPEDARDHDDAVHAREDPEVEGGIFVTVAIADVAHYVRPRSALDREARRRGNSAYFPDRVVPMLPEKLSADLCSLVPGEPRACLAVEMRFGPDGVKRSHRFVRGLMRSAESLTYGEVQAAIDGRSNARTRTLLKPVIAPLYAAYEKLAAARDRRAPLDLDLPERRIELDGAGHVKAIGVRERLEAHRLIEEFMIQANVAAAETLERRRMKLLYRVHAPPDPEKLKSLADFLDSLGLRAPLAGTVRPQMFNRIIAAAGESREVVSEVVLRSQSQAVYTPDNLGHFGLNLRRYAHFTSPIRRYADLIVHRALIAALKLGNDGLSEDDLAGLFELGESLSAAERRAMVAERESTDRYIAAFMAEREGEIFEGRIAGVTRFGLFVRLRETGADGLVPIGTLGNEYFYHDEGAHALVGERTGATYRLGDPVSVRLEEAAPVTGGLRFELLSDPRPSQEGAPRPRGRRPAKGRPARKGGRRRR